MDPGQAVSGPCPRRAPSFKKKNPHFTDLETEGSERVSRLPKIEQLRGQQVELDLGVLWTPRS